MFNRGEVGKFRQKAFVDAELVRTPELKEALLKLGNACLEFERFLDKKEI